MTTVVVTGASGFIGRALCDELSRRKVTVLAVSRAEMAPKEGIRTHTVRDYGDTPAPKDAVCVHLAGENHVDRAESEPQKFHDETMELSRKVSRLGFRNVVFVSSGAVYGDQQPHAHVESERPQPVHAYTRTKLAAEQIFAEQNFATARPGNVYGRGMSRHNVLSTLLGQLGGSGEVRIRNLAPVRDYIHVSDVARGLADIALGEARGIFNLGTGTGTSVAELLGRLIRLRGQSGRTVVSQVFADAKASTLILDPSKMRATFGWWPSVSLNDGLENLLKDQI